ncbi:MAG: hydroxymethylbilane synthase [Arenicellales bacterium]|nr:hydroxymethylbilane synthase [Arenicellales bacterium]
MTQVRIATRKSPLALWQAQYVAQQLTAHHSDLRVEFVEITTTGDRLLGAPLASAGGKGLFMKELELSLLEGHADIAVHSMKDVVVSLPDEFEIAAVCRREDPLDAFVSNQFNDLDQLPEGARVGTCSLRRQCQIRNAYPGLKVLNLRGNVNTRLRKLDDGEYEAIILAVSGLKRLNMADRIRQRIPPAVSLPAVGQGAIGIECKKDNTLAIDLTLPLDHGPSRRCVEAERAMNARLEGGCQVPIGAFAQITGESMNLDGLVGTVDGETVLRTRADGDADQPTALGDQVADQLIKLGAREILEEVYRSS